MNKEKNKYNLEFKTGLEVYKERIKNSLSVFDFCKINRNKINKVEHISPTKHIISPVPSCFVTLRD